MPDEPTRDFELQTRSLLDPAATTGDNDDGHPSTKVPLPAGGDRFALGEIIAHGGMGAIYRAIDTVLGREVAVKVLLPVFAADSAAAHRFADEARIAGQLQHPGIPPIHDLGTLPDGRPFLAMKLIKGETFDQLLQAREDPSHDRGRFLAVFEQVCQAVGFAHARNVIHRDLKPANIMVGAFGEVQVMDWGLAKVLAERTNATEAVEPEATAQRTLILSSRESDGSQTQAGAVLGTPAFMPPEQAVGASSKIDARSDVFGLGAVLAVILTGKPPFASASAETVRIQAAQGKLEECFARLDQSAADPEWVALCKRCLAPDQAARPSDAGEVAKAVAQLRQAADERARQAELEKVKAEGERAAAVATAAEQRKRRRAQAALGFSFTVLLCLVAGFAWWTDRQAAAREIEDRKRLAAEEQERQQRQAETDRRLAEEQARRIRNSAAAAELLDEAVAAMRIGRADNAAVALAEAEKRMAEAGDLAERLALAKTDLAVLRDLDLADRLHWVPVQGYTPNRELGRNRYRDALAPFGLNTETDAKTVAERITASAIRDRAIAVLDMILFLGERKFLAVLLAVDADEYREEVRKAFASGDRMKLFKLMSDPRAMTQPPGFVVAVLQTTFIPLNRRRALLESAAHRVPDDVNVLLALGYTFNPFGEVDDPDRGLQRMRWFQAAAAVAPSNPSVRMNLALSLHNVGYRQQGVAEFREAVHLNPRDPQARYWLSWALNYDGEQVESLAAIQEAVRLEPTNKLYRYACGSQLLGLKQTQEAEMHLREAVSGPDPNVYAFYSLWRALRLQGKVEEGLPFLRDAVRLEASNPAPALELWNVLRTRGDLTGAEAVYNELRRRNPARFGKVPPAYIAQLTAHQGLAYGVKYTPEGRLTTSGSEGTVRHWTKGYETADVLEAPIGVEFRCHTIWPDPNRPGVWRIVAGSFNGRILVFTPTTHPNGQTEWTRSELQGPAASGAVNVLASSADGGLLFAGSGEPGDAALRVWETTKSGVKTRSFATPGVYGIAVHPESSQIAVVNIGGRLDLWDTKTWQRKPVPDLVALDGIAYSLDGLQLAVANYVGGIRIIDPTSLKTLQELKGHTDVVVGLAFAPGGRILISGCHDKTVRLWDTRSAEMLHTFDGHSDFVRQVAIAPDGRTIASASWDRTIALWDIPPHVRPLIPTTRTIAPEPRPRGSER